MKETIMTIATFFALQLINVILNTLKALIMAKTDNRHSSAIINAITFGFYVAVVQQIGSLPLTYTIPVTMITNIIGVYVSYAIMAKVKKDNLWKVEIYSKTRMESIVNELYEYTIPFVQITPQVVTAYVYTQSESHEVSRIIKDHGAKYNITEITKRF